MPRKEIITCQIGPFANWVGAHYWNVQDDARHPSAYDEHSGDPLYDDEQADATVLYRTANRLLTPRLIVCDAADSFGGLSSAGGVAVPQTAAAAAASVDPLSWGGSVTKVEQEARAAHAFAQMMAQPLMGNGEVAFGEKPVDIGDDEDDDDDDDDEEDEDGRSPRRRRSPGKRRGQQRDYGGWQPAPSRKDAASDPRVPGGRSADAGAPAGVEAEGEGEEEEEEEVRAAVFDFDNSVKFWSDYLQAHLHARSLAPLKPHCHNYSTLARFPDGACVVQKEEDSVGGPDLVEKVRRFLEECDAVQGFHLLLDADSGFGGIASALLTQVRDDYTKAPCLALGLGTLSRRQTGGGASNLAGGHAHPTNVDLPAVGGHATVGGDANGLGAHGYTPALNDALSLTAFAELNTCYVPVYGSAGLRSLMDAHALLDAASSAGGAMGAPANSPAAASAADGGIYSGCPMAAGPPLLAPRSLRYHTAAPLATMLDAVTLPYRTHGSVGSLHGLVRSLAPRSSMHLSVACLGLPMPNLVESIQRDGWLAPLLPLQRAPSVCRAFSQQVTWLGHEGGGRVLAPLIPSLLPCGGEGGGLWARPQPFALPLSFPQFFTSAVGVKGEVYGAPNEFVSRAFRPSLPVAPPHSLRGAASEVLSAPVAAALQSTTAIMPVLRRVIADWQTDKRAAERAGSAEGWAQRDELAEVTEMLASMRETYGEDEGASEATSGWSSG